MNFTAQQLTDLVLLSAGAFFACVWAMGQLIAGGRRAWMTAALVAISGLWLLSAAYFASGLYQVWPHGLFAHLPAVYCLGPLLYLYYRSQLNMGGRADRWLPLHFLPAVTVAMSLVPFFALPPMERLLLLQQRSAYSTLLRALSLGPKISVLTYVVACALANREVLRSAGRDPSLRTPLLRALWALLFPTALGISAGILSAVLGKPALLRVSVYSLPLLLILFYLLSVRHPDLLPKITREMRRGIYARSKLEHINVPEIARRMDLMMAQDQLYADEDLSLQKLAASLDVTHHQLSQILNEQLGTPFKGYVNRFRVDAARRMLLAEPDRSILSVAFAVGFNSKSAFHRTFNETVGTTPLQFRRKYSGQEGRS